MCRVLKNYSARKNSAHKAASRLSLPCVSLAVTLLMKATARQVKTYRATSTKTAQVVIHGTFRTGSQKTAGLGCALNQLLQCLRDGDRHRRVQHWPWHIVPD